MPDTKTQYIVALDQGTTSSRSIIYDLHGAEIKRFSKELPVRFPRDGWVEQDAMDIWHTQLDTLKAVSSAVPLEQIKALGITNQRETIVVWDKTDGKPLAPAIVWQCRRSAQICKRLKAEGVESLVRSKTGLVLDPYFSGSKIIWLIENTPGLKQKVLDGHAQFGTVDSWILYNLLGRESKHNFITEPTNASRTLLFSLINADWDDELLRIFSVSRANLPEIRPSNSVFGTTLIFGKPIPVCGVLGDQQASLFGHGCIEKNTAKCTFGTGAFLLANTGADLVHSSTGLVTTVASALATASMPPNPSDAKLSYALEGSIFVAGAVIQWLRDKLGIIASAAECETRAASVPDSAGVVIVPSFVGLGAPYWDEGARGTIFGISRNTNANHIIRAALEGVAHQVADLFTADEFSQIRSIKIDGGMSRNPLFCQILSDICQLQVEVAQHSEMTAFGAARMAGLGAGFFGSLRGAVDIFKAQTNDGKGRVLTPQTPRDEVSSARLRWQEAVRRSQRWTSP